MVFARYFKPVCDVKGGRKVEKSGIARMTSVPEFVPKFRVFGQSNWPRTGACGELYGLSRISKIDPQVFPISWLPELSDRTKSFQGL